MSLTETGPEQQEINFFSHNDIQNNENIKIDQFSLCKPISIFRSDLF